ncbi:MAG: hypothetical protein FRX49_05498 [Trebouxia sp. A1-2]|nr:MAG: hypothetical protein FRX49_05498 [Trebouxia sp. A1-2]
MHAENNNAVAGDDMMKVTGGHADMRWYQLGTRPVSQAVTGGEACEVPDILLSLTAQEEKTQPGAHAPVSAAGSHKDHNSLSNSCSERSTGESPNVEVGQNQQKPDDAAPRKIQHSKAS